MDTFNPAPNFAFEGTPVDTLEGVNFTVVNLMLDVSSSISPHIADLRKMAAQVIEGCGKSPYSENLLVRTTMFSSRFTKGVSEVHGYKPLRDILPTEYDKLSAGGGTPMIDGMYEGTLCSNSYCESLADNGQVNAITVVITDGEDNDSSETLKSVRQKLVDAVLAEHMESHLVIVIGLGTEADPGADAYEVHRANHLKQLLEKICVDLDPKYEAILPTDGPDERKRKEDGRMVKFRPCGQITPRALAKVAGFVSDSISSQSQALGSGGPSQNIAPTI